MIASSENSTIAASLACSSSLCLRLGDVLADARAADHLPGEGAQDVLFQRIACGRPRA